MVSINKFYISITADTASFKKVLMWIHSEKCEYIQRNVKSLQVKIQNTKNYKTYSRGTHNFGPEETTIRLLSYFIVWLVLHEKDNKWGHSILDQSSTLSEFSCPTSPMLDSSIVRKNSSHVTYILYLYTHINTLTHRDSVCGEIIQFRLQ